MASLNSWKTLGLHRRQIRSKPFLHRLYIDFYKLLLSTDLPLGKIVEIGSGGGLIKDIKSEIVTSDIIKGRGIDRVFSADRIPFRPKSVAAYMMLNTFHHLKDPEKALVEMSRTLKTGGKIRMIEPYNSWWGGWIYKYLHSYFFTMLSEDNGICIPDNESDNYAQRQFIIECEEPEPYCGDGTCNAGEDSVNCLIDCPVQSYCGDTICDSANGEDSINCPDDCLPSLDLDSDNDGYEYKGNFFTD